jgi:UDP-N-acetylmuramyl pentapeptide synthase
MNAIIVDMTHGGKLIASEFSKLDDFNVFALDIYNTLSEKEKSSLTEKGITLVEEGFLEEINSKKSSINDEFLVIAPIHCNIESEVHMTHHDAVKFLMRDKINVPVIEITGVKGKTSVVKMLKEIFKDLNPLILSSLGVETVENSKNNILKRDISITPASIIEAWQIVKNHENIEICIFETSLGGTGLADVGVLTNIAENYSIASGGKTASQAKAQIFKSKLVACDFDSFNYFYSYFDENVNTFSINGNANVHAFNIKFGLDETSFDVEVNDIKTINGEILNTKFHISTFAPAEHHVNNVLSAICTALTLNIPISQIKKGLMNFKGVEGRTSMRNYKGSKIIEEINPGINVTAIKKSVKMIEDFEKSTVIFGGKYGVTCEEIDEDSTVEFLNEMDDKIKLILVDELGKNIKTRIKRKYMYTDFDNAIDEAVKMNSKMILLIYRSNFSDLDRR